MLFLAVLATMQNPVIISREPRPASPWTVTFDAACGSERLEIGQPIYPAGQAPEIRINGQRARGDVRLLQQEVGERRAAYRFSLLCPQQGDRMHLRWVRGLADQHGHVAYRSGAATFQGGELISSHAEESNAETFWYR